MQIAQVLAGYTLAGADLLRRADGQKEAEEMAKPAATSSSAARLEAGVLAGRDGGPHLRLMEKFAGYGFTSRTRRLMRWSPTDALAQGRTTRPPSCRGALGRLGQHRQSRAADRRVPRDAAGRSSRRASLLGLPFTVADERRWCTGWVRSRAVASRRSKASSRPRRAAGQRPVRSLPAHRPEARHRRVLGVADQGAPLDELGRTVPPHGAAAGRAATGRAAPASLGRRAERPVRGRPSAVGRSRARHRARGLSRLGGRVRLGAEKGPSAST